MEKTSIKAVLFDFMGTCLDWHSSIVETLPHELSEQARSRFALDWRQAYFDYNAQRVSEGRPVEDFDDTQRTVLDLFLDQQPEIQHHFSPDIKESLVAAWHHQHAWPDVAPALHKLRHDRKLQIYVHANGSTRLQLDLVNSAGLQYDMLFSSELLGCYKPAPENYRKVLRLLQLKAEECVMVAAHDYDLQGAKEVGMRTVYVYRWTDDILEDQEAIKRARDAYLLDMSSLDSVIASL